MNFLSVDLESFAYPNFEPYRSMDIEQREKIDDNFLMNSTEILLELLDKNNAKATFFIIAEQYNWKKNPIDLIDKSDHEIAYHTYDHKYLKDQKSLLEDLKKSREFMKRFKPIGYRSPGLQYSNNFDHILKDNGFKYKSNLFNTYNLIKKNNELLNDIYISRKNIFFQNKDTPSSMSIKGMLKYNYFGSAYMIPILNKKKIINILQDRENNNIDNHIFIHNWQILKTKNSKKMDLKNIKKNLGYYPYTIDIKKKLDSLIKEFNFTRLSEKI